MPVPYPTYHVGDRVIVRQLMILLTVGFSPPPCSSPSPQPSPMNPKTVSRPLLSPSMIYFKESNNHGYCL